ncbi:hypothetical protein [Methylobacterium isbiliense]|uniref:Uncharacterized protein n=1 Tax=Methylobacterium isbiliense TaxID=315478 RepID=A0ABQ4SFG8_9HYPH|nr:hypothetical protein [Methylobacterium isbiliense]MDN3622606.1 hypothetical protein [Methylobacterium isbiliense]GJE00545.1 hypothetical protein GMJLKIPL_2468 [Methylobacterium isbiliense]
MTKAREREAASASDVIEIPLRDERGGEIGVTLRLGPVPDEPAEDDPSGVKTLAARVQGWSKLVVDGETYTFSRARALALLQRFPHFRHQVAMAAASPSDR